MGRSIPLLGKSTDNKRNVPTDLLSITLFLLIGEVPVRCGHQLFPPLHKVGWYQQRAVVTLRNAFAVHVTLPMAPSLVLNRCEGLHQFIERFL